MSRFAQEAEWLPFLQKESRLPGPRANLELLTQFVEECTQASADLCLATLKDQVAPDTPMEFVAMCGVAALGKMLSQGLSSYAPTLRSAASHPSARVREGVVLALQTLGRADKTALLELVSSWDKATAYEKRAQAAALCTPDLLKDSSFALQALAMLDDMLVDVGRSRNNKGDDYKALKKTLNYCLCEVVVALPEEGKAAFEEWTQSPGLEVRAILNENLKLGRLRKPFPDWVDQQIEFLNDGD